MAEFVKAVKISELGPGQGRLVDVKGKAIALFNIEGKFFAIDNLCTHRGGDLADGAISGNEVTCPLHGARFDVTTGAAVGPPAQTPAGRYGVRVTGTDVEIEV